LHPAHFIIAGGLLAPPGLLHAPTNIIPTANPIRASFFIASSSLWGTGVIIIEGPVISTEGCGIPGRPQ
jgi:hypothetical protein